MRKKFDKRVEKGQSCEDKIEKFLTRVCKSVAKNGTEHTHPFFVDKLRKNDSLQSKLVRYAPDGVVLKHNGDVIHWDAKGSVFIERDAYETYMRYVNQGMKLIICVCTDYGGFFWQRVDQIEFDDNLRRCCPRDENGWLLPRECRNWDEHNGSGTPYKLMLVTDETWHRFHIN